MVTGVNKVDWEVVRGCKNDWKISGTRNGGNFIFGTSGYSYTYQAKYDASDSAAVITLSSTGGEITMTGDSITVSFPATAFTSIPYKTCKLQHQLVFNDGTNEYTMFVGELTILPNVKR